MDNQPEAPKLCVREYFNNHREHKLVPVADRVILPVGDGVEIEVSVERDMGTAEVPGQPYLVVRVGGASSASAIVVRPSAGNSVRLSSAVDSPSLHEFAPSAKARHAEVRTENEAFWKAKGGKAPKPA